MKHKWILFLLLPVVLFAAGKKSLTVEDIMAFRQLEHAVISDDGQWVGCTSQPDRGNGEALIYTAKGKQKYVIPRGRRPVFAGNGLWAAVDLLPDAVEMEKAGKEKPKKGMVLIDLEEGDTLHVAMVDRFAFSSDGQWLAWTRFKSDKKKEKSATESPDDFDEESSDKKNEKRDTGTELILRHLETGAQSRFPFVKHFAFDSSASYLAFSVADTNGQGNGLLYIDLKTDEPLPGAIEMRADGWFDDLSWSQRNGMLAFASGVSREKDKIDSVAVAVWNPADRSLKTITDGALPDDWYVPSKNNLTWTRDGQRLFLGLKPEAERWDREEAEEDTSEIDLLDVETILKDREVDVWHWNDPRIKTNEKHMWKTFKDRYFRAVYHLAEETLVPLADPELPSVRTSENPRFTLASSDVPYQKLITWDGRYRDLYCVNLQDGSRHKVANKIYDWANLSPDGKYIAYYFDKQWYLYDTAAQTTRCLTDGLEFPFYNEDHDYPQAVDSYGMAGWTPGDRAVLIYDKFDIWQFDCESGNGFRITDGVGRQEKYQFRIRNLDREAQFYEPGETLLLSAYHDMKKNTAFFTAVVGRKGVQKKMEMEKKFTFRAKAKKADALLYTRESYTEFPDLWVSDLSFKTKKKVTDLNPQVKEFAWGEAELVEWTSDDGIPLQGILIKPGNYEKGKKYPVLVYYYRFFTQRMYDFNQVVINHRPCYPFYASNGYAIFLPDVRFKVGLPGPAATQCLVPGVKKIIDMGIADPNGICLHGHSWSGYQTAFVVTQTDLFTCCIAGAPVSNMTSAYGGIRWGTGLSRQFQYEKSQSRIGKTLWDGLGLYIENSPVFYADRIHTPMLIMFGDEDGAVPWTQGIELYMAMRRLEKDCVFLQYRGEDHHPKKYANKLDYTLKFKAYVDHYCKGAPAPKWISEGVPYRGK